MHSRSTPTQKQHLTPVSFKLTYTPPETHTPTPHSILPNTHKQWQPYVHDTFLDTDAEMYAQQLFDADLTKETLHV